MNSKPTQFSLCHPTSKTSGCRTVRACIAAAAVLAFASVNATHAQVNAVAGVVVTTNALDGLPNSALTLVDNYPTQISFVVINAGVTNAGFFAMQDYWQFSTNGQSAYAFQSNDFFTVSMTVTLTGDPTSPRKEAGFAFNDVNGNINGQYILDLDQHEVVAFGGNLPFYATPVNHFYESGEPIIMGITILTDSNGKQAIIYSADGFNSPALEFGSPQTNYTLGGYFQIQGQGTGLTNMGSATFDDISITASPTGLDILGPQIAQVVSITGTELAQGTASDHGNVNTTKAPSKTTITTAKVLQDLAKDENTGGKFGETNFPPGAKLLYTADAGFQVVYKQGNQQLNLNVDNILSVLPAGQNEFESGTFLVNVPNGWTTPPFSQTNVRLVTLTYDATSVGGTMKFSATGLGSSVTTTTKPTPKDKYNDTDSFSLQNGTGEGVNGEGVKIIVTGLTVSSGATATLEN